MMELSAEKFISSKEANKLFKIISSSKNVAAQVDSCLFQLLALTGLRISEALSLKWKDYVDEGYLVIKAENSKNNKRQTVHLGKRAISLLKSFRDSNPYKGGEYIFNSQKGPLRRESAHIRLKSWLSMAGLRNTIHLHSFRHSWAVNALEAGVSLPLIRDQLRHSNISITSAYLSFTKDSLEKFKDAF